MKSECTIINTTCSHCGKRKDQNSLFQGHHDPSVCICNNCIVDYNQVLEEKEDKLEKDFLNILSQFKDQKTAIEINMLLIELERIDPQLLEEVHDYIKYRLSHARKKNNPDPPDIIA